MEINAVESIQRYLEELYDIPFDVRCSMNHQDPCFRIKPHNDDRELFAVEMRIKEQIRIIIEVTPEKYAASSINDMGTASPEKKAVFVAYAEQLEKRKAKTEFYINDIPADLSSPRSWPEHWRSYRLRISKSPVCGEDEKVDEAGIVSDWGAVVTGMFLSLLDITIIEAEPRYEGGSRRVEQNRYERHPVNRELCLAANGYICKVCGFDFERTYGEIGHHFIHVHHIVPVSEMEAAYIIDPVNDMVPVCPNCHAMLHKKDPPFSPEQLSEIIREKEDNG